VILSVVEWKFLEIAAEATIRRFHPGELDLLDSLGRVALVRFDRASGLACRSSVSSPKVYVEHTNTSAQ
jgi:hypothetical protein